MFTGIVEEIGRVERIKHGQHSAVLTIHADTVLDGKPKSATALQSTAFA